jgi:hypothetical protein
MFAAGRVAAKFDNGHKPDSEPKPTLWSKLLRLRFMDLMVAHQQNMRADLFPVRRPFRSPRLRHYFD